MATRVGDVDRDITISRLSDGLSGGYITQAEFDERSAKALVAQYHGELTDLIADLPGPKPVAERPDIPGPLSNLRPKDWTPVKRIAHVSSVAFGLMWLFPGTYEVDHNLGAAAGWFNGLPAFIFTAAMIIWWCVWELDL